MHEITNLHNDAKKHIIVGSNILIQSSDLLLLISLICLIRSFFLLLETFFICLCGSVSGLCKLKVVWDKHLGGF